MHRARLVDFRPASGLAPWAVAGALLLATGVPVAAQDATPPPDTGLEVVAAEDAAADDAAAELPVVEEGAVEDAAVADAAVEGAATEEEGGGGGRNREGRGGEDDLSAVPAVGVAPGPNGGLIPLALGAAIAAVVAAAAALRGRLVSG